MEDVAQSKEFSRLGLALEERLQWGPVEDWTTRDFERLSEDILDRTEVSLSVTTLKRVLGRVQYHAVPNGTTLDALAQYIGYPDWRAFQKSGEAPTGEGRERRKTNGGPRPKTKRSPYVLWGALAVVLTSGLAIWLGTSFSSHYIDPDAVRFHIKRVARGAPNTVVFSYDVRGVNARSVELQQDWNPEHRFPLDREKSEFTLFYKFPGYYRAKLVVDGQIVREENLFIPSDGWMAAVDAEPQPRYILNEELIRDSSMRVSAAVTAEIADAGEINWLNFYYLTDTPRIDGRNFTLEARFRHTLRTGSNICQNTRVLLYGTEDVIRLPFSIPGCVGRLNAYLAGELIRGQDNDLSGFGYDLANWVDLKVINRENRLSVLVNGAPALERELPSGIGRLGGVRFGFEGLGEVGPVSLNGNRLLP